MYTTSQKYKDYIASGNRQFEVQAIINSIIYASNEVVEFSIEDAITCSEELTIGTIIPAKLSIKIKTTNTIASNAKVEPQLRLNGTNGYTEWIPMGCYYIDTRNYSNGVWTFECVDKLIMTEQPYVSNLAYPVAMSAVFDEILNILNLQSDIIINPAFQIPYKDESISVREMLSCIASAHGANVKLSRDEKLIFVLLENTAFVTTITANNYIKTEQTNVLKTFTRLEAIINSKSETVIRGTGDADHTLNFENRFMFLEQVQADYAFSVINNFSYTPYNINWTGKPDLDVGDTIKIILLDTTEITTIIAINKISFKGGLLQDSSAPSKSKQQNEYKFQGNLSKQIQQKITKDIPYYGVSFGPSQGIKIMQSDGKSEAIFNSDIFTMRALEDGVMKDKLYFDPITGKYVFNGELLADQITSGTLSGITLNVDTNVTVGKQLMIGSMQDASDKYIKFGDNMYIFTSSDGLNLTLHNYEGNISNAAIGDYNVTAQDTLQLTGLNGITLTTDKVSVGTTSGTEFNNEFVSPYLSEDLQGTATFSDGWTVNGSVYTCYGPTSNQLYYPVNNVVNDEKIIVAFNYTGEPNFLLDWAKSSDWYYDSNEDCYKFEFEWYETESICITPQIHEAGITKFFTGTFEMLYIKKHITSDCKVVSFNNFDVVVPNDDSIFIGGGGYYNTTGNYNIAIGHNTLKHNTTGSANVAIGDSALEYNETGRCNVAIGDSALVNNTIGEYNVAVGIESLHDNTTGSDNTAVGYEALTYNTDGRSNTAVGHCALLSNSIGDSNTAIGSYALNWNETGSFNTAIGNEAMLYNTTGEYNTALGYSALQGDIDVYNNTSNKNTAIGFYALNWNKTGVENTALGYNAFWVNTTGSYNIAIGSEAGRYDINSNNNYDSDYSIYIGNNTKSSSYQAQNEIVIGYDARGYGDDTAHIGNNQLSSISFGAGTGTAFTNRSDRRLKEDIQDADNSICYNDIKNLPLHRFKYKDFVGNTGDQHLTGFIADEFETKFPKAVFKNDHSFPVLDENGNKIMKTIIEEITEVVEDEEKVKEIKAKYALEKTKERKEMTTEEKAAIKLAKEKEKEELKAAKKTITKTVEKQVEETFVIEQCASIDTSQITPTIVGAIKALIDKVEVLENEIAILKQK